MHLNTGHPPELLKCPQCQATPGGQTLKGSGEAKNYKRIILKTGEQYSIGAPPLEVA